MTNTDSSLSDSQEKLLAILPIPSSILSIFGSITIICMAYKTRRYSKWSTYTRLLVAMSVFDLIFTTTFTIGGFLLPSESSMRVWAFGSDATCSMVGFLLQFSYAGVLYNGMLSYYFLLAAKYGMKKSQMSRYVEPIMHFVSLGYPFATSIAGLIMGIYHETELGQSCWIANYPENCGEGPDETGEPCQSTLLAYVFGAVMVVFTLGSLIGNNIAILIFVRKQVVPPEWKNRGTRIGNNKNNNTNNKTTNSSRSSDDGVFRKSNRRFLEDLVVAKSTQYSQNQENDIEKDVDVESPKKKQNLEDQIPVPPHSITTTEPSSSLMIPLPNGVGVCVGVERLGSSGALTHGNENGNSSRSLHNNNNDEIDASNLRREQHERLQMVASQSYLYVVAFFVPIMWTVILRILEGLHYSAQDENKLFPLLILQQVLLPIQGCLNLLVYARPKYLKFRKEYPEQTRLFAFRRAIYGDSIKPDPKRMLPPVDDSHPEGSATAAAQPKEIKENEQQLARSPGRRRRDGGTAMTAESPHHDVNSTEPLSRPNNNMLTRSIQSSGEEEDDLDEQLHNGDHFSYSCNNGTGDAEAAGGGGSSSSRQNKPSTTTNKELLTSSSVSPATSSSKQSSSKNITAALSRFLPPMRRFSVQDDMEDTAQGLGAPPSRKKSVNQKSQWTAIRLTGALISSLTASRGDFSIDYAEDEEENGRSSTVKNMDEEKGRNKNPGESKSFERAPVACIDMAAADALETINPSISTRDTGRAASSHPPSDHRENKIRHQSRRRTERVICYSDLTEPLESVCENPYEDEADDCSLSSSSRKKSRFMADHVVESSATAITPPRRRSSLRQHGVNDESRMPVDTEQRTISNTTAEGCGAAPPCSSSDFVVDLEFDRMNLTNHSKHSNGSRSSSLDAPLRIPSRQTSAASFGEALLDDDDDDDDDYHHTMAKNKNLSQSERSSYADTPLSVPTRIASSFEYIETPLDSICDDTDGHHGTTTSGTKYLDTPLTLPSRVVSSYEDMETLQEPSNRSDEDNYAPRATAAIPARC